MEPFFSIITPTYNRGELLKRAFKSVEAQQFRDFEWIIIDDGSTDDTQKIVSSFIGQNVVFISMPQNKGVNAARNRGLDAAKGEYIVFLDSDDELLPDALAKMADIWKGTSDKDIGGLITRCVDEKNQKKIGRSRAKEGTVEYEKMICSDSFSGEFHICLKRPSIGGDRFMETVVGCEMVFFLRFYKKFKMRYADVPTRIYHRGDGINSSGSMVRNAAKMTAGYEVAIRENKDAWLAHCPKTFIRYSQSLALRYLFVGEPKRARKLLRSVLSVSFFSPYSWAVYFLSFFGKKAAVKVFTARNRYLNS